MALPQISPDASLGDVLDENAFTQGTLQSSALAAPFTALFDAFQVTWTATNTTSTTLLVALGKARGGVAAADGVLDNFVDTLDRTILIAVKNNRKSPLYEQFFGAEVPSKLKRPVLDKELDTVRKWVPALQASTTPSVAALAPALVTAVANADAAVAAFDAAQAAVHAFETTGGKRQLIDAFNALRLTTYGQLAALPHQNPAAALPATFADRFFLHESRKGITAIKTVAAATAKVATIQKKLTSVQNHAANLTTEEAARSAAKTTAAASAAAAALARKNADTARKAAREAEEKAHSDKVKAKKRR